MAECLIRQLHHHLVHYSREGIKYTLSFSQMGHYDRWGRFDSDAEKTALDFVTQNYPDLVITGQEIVEVPNIYEGTKEDKVGYNFGDTKYWKEIAKMYSEEIDDMDLAENSNERQTVFITRSGDEFEVIRESTLGVVIRPKHDVPLKHDDFNYGGNYIFIDVVGGMFRVDYGGTFGSFTESLNKACQIIKDNQRCAATIERFMTEQESE